MFIAAFTCSGCNGILGIEPAVSREAGAADAGDAAVEATVDGGCTAMPACTNQRAGLCGRTDVAACTGKWTGSITNASSLCAPGWHLCSSADQAVLTTVPYPDAHAFPGCFAYNASSVVGKCGPCDLNHAMAGMGYGCLTQKAGASNCIAGGEIDVPDVYMADSYACGFHDGITTGVVCCRDQPCAGTATEPCDVAPLVTTCPAMPGCANSKPRAGLCSKPNIALCAGAWSGPVGTATQCEPTWHVCTQNDTQLASLKMDEALAVSGCFAYDVAEDGDTCGGVCNAANAGANDMAGIGNGCSYIVRSVGGCLFDGRSDVGLDTSCAYSQAMTTGVACCK